MDRYYDHVWHGSSFTFFYLNPKLQRELELFWIECLARRVPSSRKEGFEGGLSFFPSFLIDYTIAHELGMTRLDGGGDLWRVGMVGSLWGREGRASRVMMVFCKELWRQ